MFAEPGKLNSARWKPELSSSSIAALKLLGTFEYANHSRTVEISCSIDIASPLMLRGRYADLLAIFCARFRLITLFAVYVELLQIRNYVSNILVLLQVRKRSFSCPAPLRQAHGDSALGSARPKPDRNSCLPKNSCSRDRRPLVGRLRHSTPVQCRCGVRTDLMTGHALLEDNGADVSTPRETCCADAETACCQYSGVSAI